MGEGVHAVLAFDENASVLPCKRLSGAGDGPITFTPVCGFTCAASIASGPLLLVLPVNKIRTSRKGRVARPLPERQLVANELGIIVTAGRLNRARSGNRLAG